MCYRACSRDRASAGMCLAVNNQFFRSTRCPSSGERARSWSLGEKWEKWKSASWQAYSSGVLFVRQKRKLIKHVMSRECSTGMLTVLCKEPNNSAFVDVGVVDRRRGRETGWHARKNFALERSQALILTFVSMIIAVAWINNREIG